MKLRMVLLLTLVTQVLAEEESCMGRCENGFDSQRQCQCDTMCKYYQSCCTDFQVVCGMITRGDTFTFAEDDDEDELSEVTTPAPDPSDPSPASRQYHMMPTLEAAKDFRQPQRPESTLEISRPQRISLIPHGHRLHVSFTVNPTTEIPTSAAPPEATTAPVTTGATKAPDPDADVCSGRPFDSFMQSKNGSVYAFRGKYFFELDQRSVVPGFPKLIQDVWGIEGPIDAAFTRVNCQGKTYIFKGYKYWRFDNGVLDDDYPRDISVGFDKIPDHVDAAFALPASGHHGKERVYFFKGEQYYTYEFFHQPSHKECITMSERFPSTPFRQYTDIYYNNYESFFSSLFSDLPQHEDHHHFINKDWKGLQSPVDAAMAGRIYVSPGRPTPRRNNYDRDQWWNQQYGQQWNQQYGQQWGRRRQNRSPHWGSMAEQGMNMGQEMAEKGMEMGLRLAERRMEMEERLGRDWSRRWDQDWDQDRRRDRYGSNNRGNYDSRNDRSYRNRAWGQPTQSVYFFKGGYQNRVFKRRPFRR
uniref:Vitronectin a n=1 Tax=Cynoglossus semilaevis TaxID=244447 RepID=A0A3P8VD87_CYNSE